MERIDRWCTGTAMLVTVFAAFWWGGRSWLALAGALNSWQTDLYLAAVLTAAWICLAVLVPIAAAGRGRRIAMLEIVSFPLMVMFGWLMVLVVLGVIGNLLLFFFNDGVERLPAPSGVLLTMAALLGLVAVCLVMFAIVGVSIVWVPTYAFRAVDGHPTLPEIVGVIGGAASLIVASATVSGGSDRPLWVDLAMAWIPSLVPVVLGVCGLARLRRRYGVGLGWLPSDGFVATGTRPVASP